MGKLQQKLKRWAVGAMNLPPDLLLDMPRITMIGPLQMYVENHQGVLFFNDQEVRFLLSNKGQLLVRGQNFVIRKILPEEVMLEGRIREIRYLEPDQ
jgi:sporulation protein YqfC